MRIGVIGGSGFDEFPEIREIARREIGTRFGPATAFEGAYAGKTVLYVSRHGKGHQTLSHQVNHRANLLALKELGADAIVATTVTGVARADLRLGVPIVFDDLYFPENRLPDGNACTIFDRAGEKGRGHLIAASPFSASLRAATLEAIADLGIDAIDGGAYAHVNGPRFNTKAEIAALRLAGVAALSQTAGPEAVLAGELEIPYQLIGFGVDYANGVQPEPTSVEALNDNMAKGSADFRRIILRLIERLDSAEFDSAFVYRFD